MPITYEIDENLNFLHVKASGCLTDAEILEFQSSVMTDEKIKPGFRALFDAKDVTSTTMSERMVNKILGLEIASASWRQKALSSRTAFVFGEALGKMLVTEFAQRADRIAAVFENIELAKKWLFRDSSTR